MGNTSSQYIRQTFGLDAVTKLVYDQVTNNTQKMDASSVNIQKMKLNVGGDFNNCGMISNQTLNTDMQTDVNFITESVRKIKNKITSEMNTAAEAAIEKKKDLGDTSIGEDEQQTIIQDTQMNIQNIVETVLETNNLQETVTSAVNIQQDTINIAGSVDCGGLTWDRNQNMTAKMATEAIMQNFESAIAENTVLNTLAADAGASQKSTKGGLAQLVGAIGQAIGGPMMAGIAGSVMCVCLVIVSMLMVAMSPAGQGAVTKGANTASKRYG